MNAMSQTINQKRAYFIWFLCAFFFFAIYIIRVSPSILTPTLMQLFHCDALTIGAFSGFFYYPYIAMQIPVGLMMDVYSPKKIMVFSILTCLLSTLLFATMTTINMGYLSRFIMGFGASFAFVGSLRIAALWFQPKQFAFLAGVSQSMGMLGAMIGQGPIGIVYQWFGWRLVIWAMVVVFFLIALLMMYLFKMPQTTTSSTPAKIKPWSAILTILNNKQTWYNCLFIGLVYGPTACFGEQWGASFLSQHQGISIDAAGQETGLMFIGIAIGCPLMGWLSDYIQRRLIIMQIGVLGCLISLSLIIYGSELPGHWVFDTTNYGLLLFVYGIANSCIVASYAFASEINPPHLTGIALGITNMACVILGALMIPLVGFVLDATSSSAMLQSMPSFSSKGYQIAFAALPIGLALAFLVSLLQKETYCRHRLNTEAETSI